MINDNSNINSISDGADFWHYQIGVIIITVNTPEKITHDNRHIIENWFQTIYNIYLSRL